MVERLLWKHICELLKLICEVNENLTIESIKNSIKNKFAEGIHLEDDIAQWKESLELRKVIGCAAKKNKWIKKINLSEKVFSYALPNLPDTSVIKTKLWDFIQNEDSQ